MGYRQLICQPVSETTSCGNDLSDDAGFQNFFFMAEGQPEKYDGKNTLPAEPPSWTTIKKQALSYLAETKDLQLISVLSQAVLNTEGLAEFEQCLNGVADVISQSWQEIYPLLDEDDDDPQARLSAIGLLSDHKFVLNFLKSYPLAKSNLLGSVTLQELETSSDTSQIKAIFKDSNQDDIIALHEATNACIKQLDAINKIFIENAGMEYCVNFDSLTKLLTQMNNAFDKYADVQLTCPAAGSEDNNQIGLDPAERLLTADIESRSNVENLSFANSNIKLTSRSDVEKCLELICFYFEEHEPSSPVPLLMNRAKKVINLDFMGIVKEMAPESFEQLNKLGGLSE